MIGKLDYNLPFRAFKEMLEESDSAIKHAVSADHERYDKDNNKSFDGRYYPYIPFRGYDVLVKQLIDDGSTDRGWRTFLDVGCGSGRILALKKYLTGFPVIGIEIRPEIAKLGSKIYDINIINGDAFMILSKTFFRDNHISTVYTYMPILDIPLMKKLELHIEESIPCGYNVTRIEMLPRYLPCCKRDDYYNGLRFNIEGYKKEKNDRW